MVPCNPTMIQSCVIWPVWNGFGCISSTGKCPLPWGCMTRLGQESTAGNQCGKSQGFLFCGGSLSLLKVVIGLKLDISAQFEGYVRNAAWSRDLRAFLSVSPQNQGWQSGDVPVTLFVLWRASGYVGTLSKKWLGIWRDLVVKQVWN